MSECRKYDVEQYGGFLCGGVFRDFPIVSWAQKIAILKTPYAHAHLQKDDNKLSVNFEVFVTGAAVSCVSNWW